MIFLNTIKMFGRVYRREEAPSGAFQDGIRLRGYTRPSPLKVEKTCCFAGNLKNSITDINKDVDNIMKSHGKMAYTVEVYFSWQAPLIFKEIGSSQTNPYDIVYSDLLSVLSSTQVEMIEAIQIEYYGEKFEFSKNDIEEIKVVALALINGGYIIKRDPFAANFVNQMW